MALSLIEKSDHISDRRIEIAIVKMRLRLELMKDVLKIQALSHFGDVRAIRQILQELLVCGRIEGRIAIDAKDGRVALF